MLTGDRRILLVIAEDTNSIIGTIFEQASNEEPMKLVAGPLQALWSADKWGAETIRAELDAIANGLLGKDAE